MRWQTTAVLAIVLLALGAFYYVYEIRLGPERERAEGRKGRVFEVEPRDVNELTLRRGGETVRLRRDGDGWQMVEPVKARGERGPIEEVLTAVATAKMDREIAAAPPSLAEFGLDKPAAEITLVLKDARQLGLVLGARNPTGVWVYARARDKSAVFVVSESVLRDATRPPADFRDRTVLAFDRKDVTALDIVTRDETLAVEAADGKWKLTRPAALPADTETVADFLDKLQAARVREFVAESPPSLGPFGLERPLRVTIHTGRDKERAAKSLLLGGLDAAKKGVYAQRPGEPTVLLLAEDVWTAVPRTVAAVRNRVVVEFDRDKVTRLEIESPKGAVTLVREQNRWRIAAPEALPADQVEVGAILFKLRELRAQAFLSEDASGLPRYLARPEVRVTLTEEGAPGPRTLLLAPSPERRGGAPSAYAALAGRGPVVLVDAKALGELGRPLDALRDRILLSGLEPRDVRRIRIQRSGKSLLLERRGDAEWTVIEPGKGPAKSAAVDDLLYTLRALKWKERARGGDEPARYGLDAPAMEVGLFRADGTEIATVIVGKREAERAWVKTKAAPAVYAVDPKQLGELPKIPEDFAG